MGPLYYIPGESKAIAKPAELARLGLGYALEDRAMGCAVTEGPGGSGEGVVVADPTRVADHRIGYYEREQRWRKAPGLVHRGAPIWVGVFTSAPPTPEDLVRLKPLPGHWVTLGDGQRYVAPVARAVDESADSLLAINHLPQGVSVDDDGQWQASGTLPAYERLWRIALAWWDARIAGAEEQAHGTVEFSFAGGMDAALECLSVNYRISKAEVALLGLFTQTAAREILDAAIDWPTLERWLKKKVEAVSRSTAAGSSTGGGSGAERPATSPPSPISRPSPASSESGPPSSSSR